MRKKSVIILLISFLYVISAWQCKKIDYENNSIETENNVPETENNNISETENNNNENSNVTVDNVDDIYSFDYTGDSSFESICKMLFQKDDRYNPEIKYDDWREMYASVVCCDSINNGNLYYLLWLDDDETPELVNYETRYSINYIWSFESGAEDKCAEVWGKMYISEKNGLIIRTQKNDDHYLQYIDAYSYDRGEINELWKYEFSSDGEFELFGGKVDEKTFNEINEKINLEDIKCIEEYNCYSMEEILFAIKTGHDSSFNHRYEIVMDDVSWDEAQEKCKEKGGYLAVISSEEESQRVFNQIYNSGYEEDVFYIGYKKIYWILKDDSTIDFPNTNIYIFEAYYFSKFLGLEHYEEYNENEMRYGMIFFEKDNDKQKKRLLDMNLGPRNMANYNPNMSGKIGYICEYNE